MGLLRFPDRHNFSHAARHFRERLPDNRTHRTLIGVGLVSGGIFSFLPLLGIWMLPVGLVVLSIDWPRIRRLRRRIEVRLLRPTGQMA